MAKGDFIECPLFIKDYNNRDKTQMNVAEIVKNKSINISFGRALLKDNFGCICEQIAKNIKISGKQAMKM
jgi:hypothetical protein